MPDFDKLQEEFKDKLDRKKAAAKKAIEDKVSKSFKKLDLTAAYLQPKKPPPPAPAYPFKPKVNKAMTAAMFEAAKLKDKAITHITCLILALCCPRANVRQSSRCLNKDCFVF